MEVRFAAGAIVIVRPAERSRSATVAVVAAAMEAHQQPGTTHARWIRRAGATPRPIVIRWSMSDTLAGRHPGGDAMSEG
jgi:hypothetical protein